MRKNCLNCEHFLSFSSEVDDLRRNKGTGDEECILGRKEFFDPEVRTGKKSCPVWKESTRLSFEIYEQEDNY